MKGTKAMATRVVHITTEDTDTDVYFLNDELDEYVIAEHSDVCPDCTTPAMFVDYDYVEDPAELDIWAIEHDPTCPVQVAEDAVMRLLALGQL